MNERAGNTEAAPAAVFGFVERGFEPVREAFAANFARRDDLREVGAALAVYRGGRPVVDLWGGHTDRTRAQPWQRDTLVNVYSTTKGIVAVVAAMLVDEGKLRYDDPVTEYWPEYGQAGKERTTVAQLLSHQAGVTGFRDPTTTEDLYDWDARCAALARQAPAWVPGEKTSYHALTWGFLAGELIRRAAGMTVGQYIARRIAGPLGADFFLGLPSTEESRVARMLAPLNPPDVSALAQSLPPEAMMAMGNPQLEPEIPNTRAWRAAEIPAANGHASAQGIARVYAALANGGELDGTRLLKPATIKRMTEIQARRPDLLLGFVGFRDNWALGMTYNQVGMLGPHPDTLGHGGWGGSFGCVNLDAGIAIGYVCNQMGPQIVGDPRDMILCQAIFDCL